MTNLAGAAAAGFGFLLAVASGAPVAAEPATAVGLSAEDQEAVRRIEAYVNSIDTLQARFIQLNPNGRFVEGSLYMWRPGRVRFEYDPPIPYRLIADGNRLIFYDAELETPTYLSVDDTPLEVLLADTVRMTNDVEVTKVERAPGSLRVTAVWVPMRDRGRVQITFSERPFELKKWSIIDSQGVAVHIALLDTRYGIELDPKLFEFKNPRIFREFDEYDDH
ncbi:MAG: outer membrane lipoprotein carrier protein LolA [Kiloniellales bacterium]